VTVTTSGILIACSFLVIGWMLHMVWDALLARLDELFGGMRGLVWDSCAIVGVLALCLGIGFWVKHAVG
jgi:hypothetical protein